MIYPGATKLRTQSKFALPPIYVAEDVPIKIDFPDHMDLNVDKIDTQLYNNVEMQIKMRERVHDERERIQVNRRKNHRSARAD